MLNAALRGEQRMTTKLNLATVNAEPNQNKKCPALGVPLKCFVMPVLFSQQPLHLQRQHRHTQRQHLEF